MKNSTDYYFIYCKFLSSKEAQCVKVFNGVLVVWGRYPALTLVRNLETQLIGQNIYTNWCEINQSNLKQNDIFQVL